MGKIVFGMILGLILAPVIVLAWFHYGNPPVAVGDSPLPGERMITSVPLEARIEREAPQKAAVEANEDTFVAGARLYSDRCAVCHGFHGKPAAIAAHMFPSAPQLWQKHPNSSVIGVSDDPPGETYWKIANGIRLTGMPAFQGSVERDRDVAGEPAAGQCRQAAAAGGFADGARQPARRGRRGGAKDGRGAGGGEEAVGARAPCLKIRRLPKGSQAPSCAPLMWRWQCEILANLRPVLERNCDGDRESGVETIVQIVPVACVIKIHIVGFVPVWSP